MANYTMDDATMNGNAPGPCTCFACGHPTTAGDEDWKYLFRPLEGHTITLCERHGTDVREHRLKRTVFGNTKYLRMFLKPNLHHKPLKFDVTQICRDHQRGNCTRGVMCRFLHICRKLPLQAPTPTYGAVNSAAGIANQSLVESAAGTAHVKSPTSASIVQSPDKLVSSSPLQQSVSSRMASGGASTPLTPVSPHSPASLEALATILAAAGSINPGLFSLAPPPQFLVANQNVNGVVMPPSIATSGTPNPFLAMPVPSSMPTTPTPPPQKLVVQSENIPQAPTSQAAGPNPAHLNPATQVLPTASAGPSTSTSVGGGGSVGSTSTVFPFGKSTRESHPSLPLSPFLMSHTPHSSRPALRSVSNAAQPQVNSSSSVFSPLHQSTSTSAHTTTSSYFPSSGYSSSNLFGPAACQSANSQGPSANYENVDTEASKAAASADLLKFAGIFHSSTA